MKRFLGIILIFLMLCGCSHENNAMDVAVNLRNTLFKSDTCTFDAQVTADFGEMFYTFKMHCKTDGQNLLFEVVEPETISGVSGSVAQEGGKITFDDQALLFDTIADGRITPVSVPWLLMKTLTGGYIRGAGKISDGFLIQLDDSYDEDPLKINLQLNMQEVPVFAEIFWQGKRVASIKVENFVIL